MPRLPGPSQKRVPPPPLLVDKQTAAKWQINCSIRNVLRGECPISNHLIVMSTREILDSYARKKRVTLRADIEHIIKPEYLGEARKFWKERYNYLKHADWDPDVVTEFTNVQVHNENEILLNMLKYQELFKEQSHHMAVFSSYLMARYPRWFNMDAIKLSQHQKDFIARMNKEKRRELCETLWEVLEKNEPSAREIRQAQRMSYAEAIPVPAAEKDGDGKYFARSA